LGEVRIDRSHSRRSDRIRRAALGWGRVRGRGEVGEGEWANRIQWIETLERRVDVLEFIEIVKAANLDPVELMERVLKGVGG